MGRSPAQGTARVDLPADLPPGLHRVTLDLASARRAETRFWVFDSALFGSGDRLSFDRYTLRRAGRPEPVVGTTVMSATVHRDFVFEPDAAVWDDTFAEVAGLGMNVVRTGFWAGWAAIAAAVEDGATLVASGWFETDDARLPAERLGAARRPLGMVEQIEGLDGGSAAFRFGGTLAESWYAAAGDVRRTDRKRGAVVHHPLPIEWADATPALAAHYRHALAPAGVRPLVAVESSGPGVTLVTLPMRRDWLLVAVNESSSTRWLDLSRPGHPDTLKLEAPAGRANMAFVDPHRWTIVDSLEPLP